MTAIKFMKTTNKNTERAAAAPEAEDEYEHFKKIAEKYVPLPELHDEEYRRRWENNDHPASFGGSTRLKCDRRFRSSFNALLRHLVRFSMEKDSLAEDHFHDQVPILFLHR
jgi:hypothetical protein